MVSFLLVTNNDANTIWPVCQRLSQATVAGDQVLVIDVGSVDETPMLIRRFDQERGWGADVSADLVFSPERSADGLSSLRTYGYNSATSNWVIELRGDEHIQPRGITSFRELLKWDTADLIVAPRGQWFVSPDSPLPLPDAERWPSENPIFLTDESANSTALRLAADPDRLVLKNKEPFDQRDISLEERWGIYERMISEATGIGFCPHPILLTPTSSNRSSSCKLSNAIELVASHVRMASKTVEADRLFIYLDRIGDEGASMSLDDVGRVVESLELLRKALPRRLRPLAFTHSSLAGRGLAALSSGGKSAAHVELMMYLAAKDRIQIDALASEVRRLRTDLDAALPGPEYLTQLYARILHT